MLTLQNKDFYKTLSDTLIDHAKISHDLDYTQPKRDLEVKVIIKVKGHLSFFRPCFTKFCVNDLGFEHSSRDIA